jgi:tetratricopeptide (TPR) repeat protein
MARLAAGELSGPALSTILVHLARCAPCGTRFSRVTLGLAAPPLGETVPARSYGEAFQRATFQARWTAKRVRWERSATEPGITLLLESPQAERARIVRGSPRLQSYALARECLVQSQQGWFDDPTRGEELAALALLVAEHLESCKYGAAVLEDLRAEAWCHLANARRIRSDYSGAAEAFYRAEGHRRGGTGDPAEEATHAGLYSTFLRESADLDGAWAYLDHAITLHRHNGSRHLEARALISKSILERYRGDLDLSMSLLDRAAGGIEPGREPRLTRAISKNRALLLGDRGTHPNIMKALALLDPTQELTHLDRLRTVWARGILLEKLDRPDRSEPALLAARRGFIQARIPQDIALLDLDLARLYLRLARHEEALERAAAAFPTFLSRGLHHQTTRALDLFRQAGGLA